MKRIINNNTLRDITYIGRTMALGVGVILALLLFMPVVAYFWYISAVLLFLYLVYAVGWVASVMLGIDR